MGEDQASSEVRIPRRGVMYRKLLGLVLISMGAGSLGIADGRRAAGRGGDRGGAEEVDVRGGAGAVVAVGGVREDGGGDDNARRGGGRVAGAGGGDVVGLREVEDDSGAARRGARVGASVGHGLRPAQV